MEDGDNTEEDDDDAGLEELRFYVVLFHDPSAFLELIGGDDHLGRLGRWAGHLRESRLMGRCGTDENSLSGLRKKFLVLLPGVKEEVSRRWKKQRAGKNPDVDDERLEEAVTHLLLEERVECTTFRAGPGEVADYLISLTRALSEAPYFEEATELHCVKRVKGAPALLPTANGNPYRAHGGAAAEEVARDTWNKMLQLIPGISQVAASNVTHNFPTLRSLTDVYYDRDGRPALTDAQKRVVLATCIRGSGTQTKLSEAVYRLLTSRDPDELI